MGQLEEQIKVVADARRSLSEFNEAKKALYDEFQEKHAEFFGSVATALSIVGDAETALRELTLQAYAETGNKAPAVGVGIREVTKLEYDAKKALTWATERKLFLKLDVKGFEILAKSLDIDFVTISQEPMATIATNLEV